MMLFKCIFLFPAVTVVTMSNDALLYEESLVTTTNIVPPVARIEGVGKSGVDDELIISAANTYDPNKDTNGISYVWTCHDVSLKCCFSKKC